MSTSVPLFFYTETWYLRTKNIFCSRVTTRNTIILCSMYNTKITYGVKVGLSSNSKYRILVLKDQNYFALKSDAKHNYSLFEVYYKNDLWR